VAGISAFEAALTATVVTSAEVTNVTADKAKTSFHGIKTAPTGRSRDRRGNRVSLPDGSGSNVSDELVRAAQTGKVREEPKPVRFRRE
jgi:hypothetical protein